MKGKINYMNHIYDLAIVHHMIFFGHRRLMLSRIYSYLKEKKYNEKKNCKYVLYSNTMWMSPIALICWVLYQFDSELSMCYFFVSLFGVLWCLWCITMFVSSVFIYCTTKLNLCITNVYLANMAKANLIFIFDFCTP